MIKAFVDPNTVSTNEQFKLNQESASRKKKSRRLGSIIKE